MWVMILDANKFYPNANRKPVEMKLVRRGMIKISWLHLIPSRYLPYLGTIDLEDFCQEPTHRRP